LSRVAKRYAKAWFSLALENKKLEKAADDAAMLAGLIRKQDEFRTFLHNPLVTPGKRKQLLSDLFSEKVDGLTFDFLNMVSQKKRLNVLEEIVGQFSSLVRQHNNQIVAEVRSAAVLEDSQLDAIRQKIEGMTGKKAIIHTAQDKSLIGGFLIKIEDRIIDNSIRYQLEKLREQMVA